MTRRRAIASIIATTALVCIAVLLLVMHAPNWQFTPPGATPGYYYVSKVVDGDTIEVAMDSKTEKIRMIGIDTPETKKPNTEVQCFGPQASEFATKTLQNSYVRLETDPTNDNRDRYGRLLRYVYLQDGTLFAQMAITNGYAFAYVSFPFQKKNEFITWQTQAQTAKAGLWSQCVPVLQDGRWRSDYSAAGKAGSFAVFSWTILS